MNPYNKKGSTIVEAALIFPIVIITVVGVITLAIVFYEKVSDQAEYHNLLREESLVEGEFSNNEVDFIHNIDKLVEAL
jgi:hypothetical protein